MTLSGSDYEALARFGFEHERADALDLVWSVPNFELLLFEGETVVELRDEGLTIAQCLDTLAHTMVSNTAIYAVQHGFTIHQMHLIGAALKTFRADELLPGVFDDAGGIDGIPRDFITASLLTHRRRDPETTVIPTLHGLVADLAAYRAATSGQPAPDGKVRTVEELTSGLRTLLALDPPPFGTCCGSTG